ncbi:MAG: DUF2945 domain-containing protein [Pyrinomonadaceae bacterium]|nr:DUF2945 domain-containing protein [Pyrinomonadaceae bacterium]
MASKRFQIGDRVRWKSGDLVAEGQVVEVATKSGRIGDFVYNASPEYPRYIVEIGEGKHAAPRADALSQM